MVGTKKTYKAAVNNQLLTVVHFVNQGRQCPTRRRICTMSGWRKPAVRSACRAKRFTSNSVKEGNQPVPFQHAHLPNGCYVQHPVLHWVVQRWTLCWTRVRLTIAQLRLLTCLICFNCRRFWWVNSLARRGNLSKSRFHSRPMNEGKCGVQATASPDWRNPWTGSSHPTRSLFAGHWTSITWSYPASACSFQTRAPKNIRSATGEE